MKQIQLAVGAPPVATTFTITELTLAQVIALQAAASVLQRLGASPQDVRSLTPDELRALADALAAVLGVTPQAVLSWPLAQTLSVAVIAGQAFLEVNGPYLQQQIVPAIERLTAFATSLAAALQPRAPAPQ